MEECQALLKVTLLYGCFSSFLNCTNGTKSHKTSHIFYVNNWDSFSGIHVLISVMKFSADYIFFSKTL